MPESPNGRSPWVAVTLSLLLAPFVGMAYLNRGVWSLVYLGAIFGILVFGFASLPADPQIGEILQLPALAIALVGTAHAFLITRGWDGNQRLNWYARHWKWIAGAYLGVFAALLGIRTFLYQPFNVPSEAMIPTVKVGDYFLASKFAYNSKEPARGDLVVFHGLGVTLFKRIVGLPGEHIQMKNGILYINDTEVPRKRVADFQMSCDEPYCAVTQYLETLPSGASYHVIALNPAGPANNTSVFNVPSNAYFVLGDNRDNSADSRNSLGYISREQIFGKLAYRYIENKHWTWQKIE